jgi:transposase
LASKHALEITTGLKQDNKALKVQVKDLKREKRESGKQIASLKWDGIQKKKAITVLQKKSKKDDKTIQELKEALRIAKLPKNSSNSSRPPSTDLYKPARNKDRSLREKSGRKSGGQPGHKGTTLAFCHDEPDQLITHSPTVCEGCGGDLRLIQGELDQTHQVIDSTVPQRILINHQTLTKQCACGKCNKGAFPPGTEGMVNYGPGIRALVANLSVRQYVPYGRIVEFIEDFFKIHISEGTIANLLKQFANSGMKRYYEIQSQVMDSAVIGADETSVKVDGKKWWMHTYQNEKLTFIGAHPSRGQKAQEAFFPGGFPDAILVSDCLPMQLSTPAAAHQICTAHLLRELKDMRESHPEKSWPREMTALIKDALEPRLNCPTKNKITRIENRFTKLLKQNQANAPGKIPAFWKRLIKHKEKLFLFLKYPSGAIPADNNGSERAIRNVKVKVKVSGQFRSGSGTQQYAVIRSIIDTTNKQGLNIHAELVKIASFQNN